MRNDKVEQVYEKLEKQINHQPLSELFGLVAVTNAEKVILERIQEKQGQIKEYLKNHPPSPPSKGEKDCHSCGTSLRVDAGNQSSDST